MKKRILSIVLSIVMLVSLLPMNVWATETGTLPVNTVDFYLKDENGNDITDGLSVNNSLFVSFESGKGVTLYMKPSVAGETIKVTDSYLAPGGVLDTSKAIFTEPGTGTDYYTLALTEDVTENCSAFVQRFVGENPVENGGIDIQFSVQPSGYTTDENGIMAYAYLLSGNFDIRGYFDGEWKSTTFGNRGYYTYLKQGGYTQSVSASSSANGGFTRDNLNISIDLAFTNEGQTMQILYTVENIGSQTENFSLGTGADIQIGDDDCAVITPFDDGSGYKMVSDDADDYDSDNDEYAQFNFFATGYKGVTDVSDYWYGAYYKSDSTTGAYWTGNKEAAVFCGNDVSESGTFDSAASWHWANQTLPAGETATYSVLIGIGGADSEDAAESSTHKHCVCGGTGAAGDHASCEDITWTEWNGTGTFPGGNVYLTDDITLTQALTISGTVNLCLNGHTISAAGGYFDVAGTGTLNLCSCEENGIIKRTSTTTPANALICADGGATANLYNVTLDGGAVWEGTPDTVLKRGTTNSNSGISSSTPLIDAGGQYSAGGSVVLLDCELRNNVCNGGEGGAVTIGPDGVLTATNTKIYNNARTDGQAGAIKAYTGATVTLTECELYGNSAKSHGGAIQIWGNSGDTDDAKLIMNGGVIRNNKAGGVGGGIAVSDYSSFTMNGGTIKDNATTDYSKCGGGVGFGDKNTAMSISGDAVISGNVAGINANNLYIGNNSCNIVTVGEMENGANIGVTMKSSSGGVFTSGGASYVDKEYFTSDKPAYIVAADGNGNLKLAYPAIELSQDSFTYDGSAKTPTVTVMDGENPLISGVNYDITWPTDCTSVGTKTITVTFKGNYSGNKTVEYAIVAADSSCTVPAAVDNLVYTGSAQNLVTAATPTGGTVQYSLSATGTFSESIPTGTDAGTYDVYYKVIGDANHNDTAVLDPVQVSIAPKAVTVTADAKTMVYGASEPALTYVATGLVAGETLNGEITRAAGTDAGTYDITQGTVTDENNPNYTITFVGADFTITKADASCTVPAAVDNLVYTGSAQNLVTAATPTGGTVQYSLSATGTFSESIPTGTDAGTYDVYYKVIGDANHNDTAVLGHVQVKIAKQKVTMPTENTATFTYTGTAQTYMVTASTLYEISNETQTNAGSYTVIVALKDSANYEWADGTTAVREYTFKIEQKELGIAWSNTTLTYNGVAQQPTATATGVVTGEQIALLLSAPETNAGSYTATVHSIDGATAQNYKLPTNKSTSFTIEQQALTIVWGNSSFTYDGTEKFPAFNVDGICNADDVQVTKEGAQTNAGEYTAQIIGLTGSDAGNYKLTGTLTKDFVINKADQAAPAVNKADETISGKNDGKITDVTANMEYRAEGEDHYTAITGETVENLADGKYYVRVKGDSNHNPSADTAVTIGAGEKLKVKFMADGKLVDAVEVDYNTIITAPNNYPGEDQDKDKFAGWFSDIGCTMVWNFDNDTVTGDLTLYAKWSDVPVFHISGKVEQETDVKNVTTPVANANVKLMLGNKVVAEQITEADGTFYFGGQIAGDYNVVVTYRAPNSEHDKVVTALVEVHGNDADGIIVTLPQTVTNSIVKHEPAADGKDSVAAGTLVGGLEDVAAAVRDKNRSADKVEVKLTVKDTPPVTGTPTAGSDAAKQQAQQKAIQQKAGGKQLVFFDLSVVKTINNGAPETITDTGATLLEIRIPFDSGNKWGITIYRYHGDKAEVLAAVREGSTTEGFWVGDDGYIHIYTHKFSTYAVGYTVPSYGYFVPITPDTVTSADTFDAGIVVYVTMSMLAATGSAVVIGKKRKEEN